MNARIDLVGSRFGSLVVQAYCGSSRWKCVCDCGAVKNVLGHHLRAGATKSCGCKQQDAASLASTKHGHAGKIQSPEYRVWAAMLRRCTNPNSSDYPRYGGRGVSVCEEWKSFERFLSDMGARPSSRHQIDRIDNSGNYELGNCRWATPSENSQNRRGNRVIDTPQGKMLLIEASRVSGIGVSTLRYRISKGCPTENLFNPV